MVECRELESGRETFRLGLNACAEGSTQTIFEILASATERGCEGVLLIGGHAMQAHGVVRQTLDVDCMATDAAAKILDAVMDESGFTEIARTSNFRRYRHATLGALDLLLVDAGTFAKLWAGGRDYDFGEVSLRVPSVSHLIALKLHAIKNDPSRELRDMNDIVQLAHGNAVPQSEIDRLCQEFGTPELWHTLLRHL